jgi:hypothetical protein
MIEAHTRHLLTRTVAHHAPLLQYGTDVSIEIGISGGGCGSDTQEEPAQSEFH